MSYSIAIDGPAGAGKSTIAKKVAGEKGFIYVDTGAMYRAMALYLMREGVKREQTELISEVCKGAKITIEYRDGEQVVLLDGENINGLIRTEEIGNMASVSSAVPAVREKLLELQQDLAKGNNVVMDGRDIGTKVLPDADVKVYLTASTQCRAKRRFDELTAKGVQCDLQQIEQDIKERDHLDITRDTSPLRQAEDAVFIDSSDMGIDEVAKAILDLCI